MFIIQGEGRGHMTQALALEQILNRGEHEVSAMLIGTNSRRKIPDFFAEKTSSRLHCIKSPNFFYDKTSKSINIWKTIFFNIISIPLFLFELQKVHRVKHHVQPDIIVNFYDIIGGFYFLLYRPSVQRICVAHQYLAEHEEFPFAKGFKTQKIAYRINNLLTSFSAHKKLALSFRELKSDKPKLSIVPPLLRQEVLDLKPSKQDHILIYLVNKGYSEEIIKWHSRNKKIKLLCFWDNQEFDDGWQPHANLTFNHINDQKFLAAMEGCIGYATTAGFESICEAMYLNKPIMMVPVKKQYEQACNAEDAILANAGIKVGKFNIGLLLNYITKESKSNDQFHSWLDGYEQVFLKEIEEFPKERKLIYWLQSALELRTSFSSR